jgi:hypothetical protein
MKQKREEIYRRVLFVYTLWRRWRRDDIGDVCGCERNSALSLRVIGAAAVAVVSDGRQGVAVAAVVAVLCCACGL